MSILVHLTAADVVRRPWKNGLGATDELLIVPRDGDFAASRFEWRVARAQVDEAGPFSDFAGFERVLVVVSGEGLLLDHGTDAPPARVPPLHPYRFAGEWSTSAGLLGGAVRDVNVLLRRDAVEGVVTIVPGAPCESTLQGTEALVHVLAGECVVRIGVGVPLAVAAGESLFVQELTRPTTCAIAAGSDGHAASVMIVDVTRRRRR